MLVTFLTFAAVSLLLLLCLVFYLVPARAKKPSTVPGMEPTDEKLGNIPDIGAAGSFHEFLIGLHEEFGPVASFWFGTQFCASVASAKLFREVQVLFNRPALLFEFLTPLTGPKAIQFANGAEGRRRHKIYSQAFNHESCVNLMPDFNKTCGEFADNWATLPAEEHIPLHDYMMALAIKLITSTQLGAFFRHDKATMEFHHLYEAAMIDMDALLTGEFTEDHKERYETFKKNLSKFQDTVRKMVQEHKLERESGDYSKAPFLDLLLDNASDEEEIVADAVTFVVGGFHTTGNFLTWLFYFLAIHPEVQEQVAQEVLEVMDGKGSKDFDEEDIKNLKYTTQVLDESLRCSMTAPFAARVEETRSWKLGGHEIPPGTPIVAALGVSLQDDEYYPEPDRFDPDRFSPDKVRSRPPVAFSPFGLGPRKCPGYKFSYFEVYAAVAALIPRFEFRPAFETDYFVEPKFGFVTKPETEIWLKIRDRKK